MSILSLSFPTSFNLTSWSVQPVNGWNDKKAKKNRYLLRKELDRWSNRVFFLFTVKDCETGGASRWQDSSRRCWCCRLSRGWVAWQPRSRRTRLTSSQFLLRSHRDFLGQITPVHLPVPTSVTQKWWASSWWLGTCSPHPRTCSSPYRELWCSPIAWRPVKRTIPARRSTTRRVCAFCSARTPTAIQVRLNRYRIASRGCSVSWNSINARYPVRLQTYHGSKD